MVGRYNQDSRENSEARGKREAPFERSEQTKMKVAIQILNRRIAPKILKGIL